MTFNCRAQAVLAKFQALQRFKTLNSGSSSSPWSRHREMDLHEVLSYEIGAMKVNELRACALLAASREQLENECLKLIIEALEEVGNRDQPRTLPPNGEPCW